MKKASSLLAIKSLLDHSTFTLIHLKFSMKFYIFCNGYDEIIKYFSMAINLLSLELNNAFNISYTFVTFTKYFLFRIIQKL